MRLPVGAATALLCNRVTKQAGGMQQVFCLRMSTHPVEHHVQVQLQKDRHVVSWRA
jgi:hypothetical protein